MSGPLVAPTNALAPFWAARLGERRGEGPVRVLTCAEIERRAPHDPFVWRPFDVEGFMLEAYGPDHVVGVVFKKLKKPRAPPASPDPPPAAAGLVSGV